MKRYLSILFFACSFLINYKTSCIEKRADWDWTFFVYVESSHRLHHYALMNINDIMRAHPNKNVRVLVQLHTGQDFAWRYEITPGQLHLIDVVSLSNDSYNNLVNGMQWAVSRCPSEHTALVIWNHGFGILDPQFLGIPDENFAWGVIPDEPTTCESGLCVSRAHRGCAFDIVHNSYITSDGLTKAMRTISDDILDGKKLDILGTDCCKMAMLEVCYQIKDYVDYFIGAQNCELADGWAYQDLFNQLQGPIDTPEYVAKTIISTYEYYYKNATKENLYTQSALDLTKTDNVTKNLERVIGICGQLEAIAPYETHTLLEQVRNNCHGMCQAPFYTDLYSWYGNLYNALDQLTSIESTQEHVSQLKKQLRIAQNSIKEMVIANTRGTAIEYTNGISIYYPKHRIDESYPNTLFAQTNWYPFIQSHLSQ